MVECPMPQDILKYKNKFVANLSIRESVCGALGVGCGLLGYFSWFSAYSQNVKMLLSSFVILPFFLIGFVKLYDQPFEKLAPQMILENFIFPLKRYKEVGHPEFEKYEKTRYWLIQKEEEDAEQEETQGKKKNKKNTSQKVDVLKSATYIGVK